MLQSSGTAKFDAKKKTLRVRLPIDKDKLPIIQKIADIKLTKAELEDVSPEKENEEA